MASSGTSIEPPALTLQNHPCAPRQALWQRERHYLTPLVAQWDGRAWTFRCQLDDASREPLLAALVQAAGQHRHPWARASAAEDAGVLLAARGDGDGAIASFDQAMAAYRQPGAERDVARVRSRLARLGERRRHWRCAARPAFGWASLTDTERRVANLVAEGLTNRHVGERMFLSRHTVDFHLRQIYRKLDITTRVDLTRLGLEHEHEEGHKPERV